MKFHFIKNFSIYKCILINCAFYACEHFDHKILFCTHFRKDINCKFYVYEHVDQNIKFYYIRNGKGLGIFGAKHC